MTNGTSSPAFIEATAQLRAAFAAPRVDEHALMVAVHAMVDEAKALGWPVERIIIQIKRVADVDDGYLYQPYSSDRAARQELLARAVTWCVERYY